MNQYELLKELNECYPLLPERVQHIVKVLCQQLEHESKKSSKLHRRVQQRERYLELYKKHLDEQIPNRRPVMPMIYELGLSFKTGGEA